MPAPSTRQQKRWKGPNWGGHPGGKVGETKEKRGRKTRTPKPNDENPQTLSLSSLFHDTYELVVIESADPNDASHTVWCHPGTPSVRS